MHFWKYIQELRTWFASGEGNSLKEEEFYLKMFFICGLFRNVSGLKI
jgi:hypothetical protein